MDLNQVAYFLNLAETLNFTEAARVSGVSQPSLTRAIQRLEDELGGPVVYRDGKDTRLTALGRDLVVEFMRVQSALAAATPLAAARLIIDVALFVLADLFAVKPGPDLRVDGLAIPPGQDAQHERHGVSASSIGISRDMAQFAAKVQRSCIPAPPGPARPARRAF